MTSRRLSVATGAVLALVLGAASFSWACAGQGTIAARPTSGPAGSTVTVSGAGWGQSSVAIRWSSATGPVLATAAGPAFSVAVTVPDTAEGVYYFLATPLGDDAVSKPNAPASFRVTASPAAAPAPPAPPVAEPAPAPAPAPVAATPAPAPAPATAPAASPAPAPAAASAPAAPAPAAARPATAAPVVGAPAPAPARVPAAPAPAAAPATAPAPAAAPAPAPAVAPAAPAEQAAPPAEPAAEPSAASVTDDPARGFAPPRSPALTEGTRARPAGDQGSSALLVIGLGAGVALLGAAVALAGRRRATG